MKRRLTLVTQCSVDRLPNLAKQLASWAGAASVAVFDFVPAGSEKLNPVPCFAVAQARLSPKTSAQRLAALPHLPPRAAAAGAPRPRLGLRRRRLVHT